MGQISFCLTPPPPLKRKESRCIATVKALINADEHSSQNLLLKLEAQALHKRISIKQAELSKILKWPPLLCRTSVSNGEEVVLEACFYICPDPSMPYIPH